MNTLRIALGNLYQSPVNNMSFISYFAYVNEAGKVTSRSLMDTCTLLATYLEEQEKKNEQYEANFKDIAEVLGKMVERETLKKSMEKKVETVTHPVGDMNIGSETRVADTNEEMTIGTITEPNTCPTCGKVCASSFGLNAHERVHKPK